MNWRREKGGMRWGLSPHYSVLVTFFLLCSCGYRLAGTRTHVPGGIESVSVQAFDNNSREFGLGKTLAFALEREFYRRGALEVHDDRSAGDAVITGTIREFRTYPVAFDVDDEALQYEAELIVDVSLERKSDGQVLWRGLGMYAVEPYAAADRVVVTSSSQFQRGTLNASNLEQLTEIQLTETQRRIAIDRLVATVVRDVHDRILDDF